jgi:di/tricarboxylate transporter
VTLAVVSLIALAATIAASCVTRWNPGVIALALAWLVPSCAEPTEQARIVRELAGLFPSELFLTLLGVTLLFTMAQENGTLGRVAQAAERLCGGHALLLPWAFFLLACGLSLVGAGGIAAAALVAPLAMASAARGGVPPLLMTLMVAHGAVAGGMSPFAPTGIVAQQNLSQAATAVGRWEMFGHNAAANALVAAAAYGVWAVALRRRRVAPTRSAIPEADQEANPADRARLAQRTRTTTPAPADSTPISPRQVVTLLAIAALVVGVLGFHVHVGLGAFATAAVLMLLRAADEGAALQRLPWGVIVMVCGISVLVGVVNRYGGQTLFVDLLTAVSTPHTIHALLAFSTGILSIYSSTSGVVLPAFLPVVQELSQRMGGLDAGSLAGAIVVGSNLVDVAPVSTIGALCLAAVAADHNRRRLYVALLLWALAMAVVAAAYCQIAAL